MSLPIKKGGEEHTIQIFTKKQRIENYAASPDLTPYFQEFALSQYELRVLNKSREVDMLVKSQRAIAKGDEGDDIDEGVHNVDTESETNMSLTTISQQLTAAGVFDPSEISDGRKRVLSSIVRRRMQPAFRLNLLSAYKGKCAFSGCDVESVLEAAHVLPYLGPETNHTGNGWLLRADLHTLFDLKLITIDVVAMRLLVSPSLAGTYYEDFRGKAITLPDDSYSRSSLESLERHRKECDL